MNCYGTRPYAMFSTVPSPYSRSVVRFNTWMPLCVSCVALYPSHYLRYPPRFIIESNHLFFLHHAWLIHLLTFWKSSYIQMSFTPTSEAMHRSRFPKTYRELIKYDSVMTKKEESETFFSLEEQGKSLRDRYSLKQCNYGGKILQEYVVTYSIFSVKFQQTFITILYLLPITLPCLHQQAAAIQ